MFFLLYKRADNAVFDEFPKISDHFPKISKIFQNCSEGQTNVFGHFPNIFPKITEDCRRRSEHVSIIQGQKRNDKEGTKEKCYQI